MSANTIEIDIPCDPQQLGEFAMPFALLSEAREPSRISIGAIVITADEEDPVFARVHAITSHANGPVVVHLELCRAIRSTMPTRCAALICCPPEAESRSTQSLGERLGRTIPISARQRVGLNSPSPTSGRLLADRSDQDHTRNAARQSSGGEGDLHQGSAWSDARLDFDAAHEAVIEVARRL
jgi:hypothetical protein